MVLKFLTQIWTTSNVSSEVQSAKRSHVANPLRSLFFFSLNSYILTGAVVVKIQRGSIAGKENPLAGLPDPYVSLSVIEDQHPSSPVSATPSPVDCTYMFRTEKEGSATRVMSSTESSRKVMCRSKSFGLCTAFTSIGLRVISFIALRLLTQQNALFTFHKEKYIHPRMERDPRPLREGPNGSCTAFPRS